MPLGNPPAQPPKLVRQNAFSIGLQQLNELQNCIDVLYEDGQINKPTHSQIISLFSNSEYNSSFSKLHSAINALLQPLGVVLLDRETLTLSALPQTKQETPSQASPEAEQEEVEQNDVENARPLSF